jgi:inosose dehydratase
MGISITTAPCCWGVDDVRNPNLPPWERVFDEVAAAGYRGLELGPYGYVPLDLDRVSAALDSRGLSIVAGTIFDDLASRNLGQAAQQGADLIRLPYEVVPVRLTVMDWGHDERDYAAGHPDRAPRLSNEQWADMVANIEAIADLARSRYGVRAVVHPHAGGYIEFADEIERIARDLPPETIGFCLDTGHLWYAGMDPVETLEK